MSGLFQPLSDAELQRLDAFLLDRIDENAVEEIMSLLMRHMNSIAATLMEPPADFYPLFLERVVDGITYTIVDEWREGLFLSAVRSRPLWQNVPRSAPYPGPYSMSPGRHQLHGQDSLETNIANSLHRDHLFASTLK